jgi:uncharacterized protein (TIGR00725 family)
MPASLDAIRIVSVAGSPDATEAERGFASGLGRLLALEGYAVACGGGSGAMEAVCRSASEAGGITIGILQGIDPSEANPFVTMPIPTGLGQGRNRVVALAGFALVAAGGKYGTLSEMAFALDAGRPVCAFGSWSGIPGVTPVATPQEAIAFLRSSEEVSRCLRRPR